MKQKFTPLEKKSKREQKAANDRQRITWGAFNPTARVKESGKLYNRKKSKQDWHSHERLDFFVNSLPWYIKNIVLTDE